MQFLPLVYRYDKQLFAIERNYQAINIPKWLKKEAKIARVYRYTLEWY